MTKIEKLARTRESVTMMATADFATTMSLSAAMGLLPCIHGGRFPCQQCLASRRTGQAITDAEFERQYSE